MREGVKWASVMAVMSALAAAGIGLAINGYVLGNPVGSFDVLLVPPAVVASGMLGGTLWWTFIERSCCLTNRRAISVGFLVGLLAHPLTWVLYTFGGPLFLPVGWSEPRVIVESILLFSVFSILFGGVLTIAGGVLCGLLVVHFRRRAYRAQGTDSVNTTGENLDG